MFKKQLPEYKILISCPDRGIYIEGDVPEEIMFDVSAEYSAPFSEGLIGGEKLNTGMRMLGMSLTNQAMTAQVWQGSTSVRFSIPLIFQAELNPLKDVVTPLRDLLRLTMPIEDEDGALLEAPGPRWDLEKMEQAFGNMERQMTSSETTEKVNRSWSDDASNIKNNLFARDEVGTMRSVLGLSKSIRGTANLISSSFSEGVRTALTNNISLQIGKYLFFESVVIVDVSQTATSQPERNTGIFMRSEAQVTFQTFMVPTQRDLDSIYPAYQAHNDMPEGTV